MRDLTLRGLRVLEAAATTGNFTRAGELIDMTQRGLKALNGAWVAQWQLLSTTSIVAALPPVLLFCALQKQFIAGLTIGGSQG